MFGSRSDPKIHLFRGAPIVRCWSKYQETVDRWTLCGICRVPDGRTGKLSITSEDPSQISCPYCRQLIGFVAERQSAVA